MRKINVPKYQPSQYKTKFDAVLDMLKGGETVKQIKERMLVSDSYIYAAKKKLKEMADEVVEVVKETILSVDTNVYPIGEPKEEEEVDTTLDKRAITYGAFLDTARIIQRLKAVAHQFAGQNNKTFDADQAEALDMIFAKVGRILNGDPNHIDSWIDIAGYATLVADRLQGKTR
jgi:hypothetical protein